MSDLLWVRGERVLMALVVAGSFVFLGGCVDPGDGDVDRERSELGIDGGRKFLDDLLRQTAVTVSGEATLELERDIGPTECVDDLNRGRGTYFHTLGFNLAVAGSDREALVPLLGDVGDYWRSQGYEVDVRRIDEGHPQLLGETDGFNLRAVAIQDKGIVNLAGDTPCLPPE